MGGKGGGREGGRDRAELEMARKEKRRADCFFRVGVGIQDGIARPLLPPMSEAHKGRKCLVLDLDETLLHSSFKVSFSFLFRSLSPFFFDSRFRSSPLVPPY